ncbi:MAG TPA: penicillin-binding protein 2 [Elusimicrobiota bacterium]|jgi:cell division protein FtsI (penicillin-binding protein 3)|nr:penicillin-binding protein 2 [Elusimicrobiota bacterium]
MRQALRLQICAAICLLPAVPVAGRLVLLQVVRHAGLQSKVQSRTERAALEIIPRGRILDREGRILAQSLPAWSSTVDCDLLQDPESAARRLAGALGMPLAVVREKLASGRRSVWLKRKMSYEETARLRKLKLPAVAIVPDEQRAYPNGDLARPVLGAVRLDGGGASGLEFEFNRALSGRSRKVELTRDVAGEPIVLEDPAAAAAPAPSNLRLSLDRNIQFFADSAIREAVLEYRAKRGMVLIQDPSNGELLAMASFPADPMKNAAVQDVYEPGSTFKIVMAAAALESKAVAAEERIDCENGRWELTPSVAIKDHEPMGPSTLPEIVQHSSNIGSGKIGLRLGPKSFLRYCRLFGFGYKTGLPFPAESAGLLEIPGGDEGRTDPVRLANAAFGQGLAVTPLQLVGAYSAVANGGELLEPRLVLGLESEAPRPPLKLRRVFTPETAASLKAMLELVVQKGTGVTAQIPGYRVAGKTGTAQKLDPATGKYSPTDYISSFAGFAPVGAPKFTILVVVDSPQGKHYGSEVAGPVFAKLARQMLALRGIPPELPLPLAPARSRGRSVADAIPSGAATVPAKRKSPPASRPSLPRPSLLKSGG